MLDFFYAHFVEPILRNGWFNPVNTTVYSLFLVLGVYLVFRLLKKLKIKINREFFIAVFPFIVWACSTRVLHDAAYVGMLSPHLNEFYSLPVFPTPGSYFITFGLALFVLLISLAIQSFKRISYWKTMSVTGWVLVGINFLILPWRNVFPGALVFGLTLLWYGLFFGLSKIKKLSPLLNKTNTGILAAHFLDATATTVAVYLFGYAEQHVVPRLLFPVFGVLTMFLLKILIVLPVLWIIDKYKEKPDFTNLLKITVFILGFAPGLRDTIRLMAGV